MSTLAYDPLDPAFNADPYDGYRLLRDQDPVHHRPADQRAPGFWALSRFEDIWQAVRDPETFSSASGMTFFGDEIGKLGLPPNLVMLDPPVHTRLRGLIGRGFTPKHVTRLEDSIRAFVRAALFLTAVGTYTGYVIAASLGYSVVGNHYQGWLSAHALVR